MKRILLCLLAVLAVANVAQALPCPNVPFPAVCTYLQPQDIPGGNKITMLVNQEATVQLMLDIPAGTTMLTFDAIINQYKKDAQTPSTDFQVTGLNGIDPPGTMNFIGWGAIEGNLPAFAAGDNLQYLADTTALPLDAGDGTPGPITLVMGEITLQGLADNSLTGGGMLRFYSPGGVGGSFGQVPVDLKSPGGFQLRFQNGQWQFADVAVYQNVGGDPRFWNFFSPVLYTQFGVNVLIPEPASMSLLALGGLAMLRRRR